MQKQNVNLDKIIKLFNLKGIEKRKQASMMAEILDIKYQSAKQKLDEKRGITYNEVKGIFKYFNVSLEEERNHNGIFIMNDMHVRCNVEVDNSIVNKKENNTNYATMKGNFYIINSSSSYFSPEMKKVNKIDFLPAPKLAILDNDVDMLDLLNSVCNRYGINASVFQNKTEILAAMEKESFECYIIDWLLDYAENSEEVIKRIRKDSDKTPIILLTGQLNQHEREIGGAIMDYGVELIEKPTRIFIISSILLANLFY